MHIVAIAAVSLLKKGYHFIKMHENKISVLLFSCLDNGRKN